MLRLQENHVARRQPSSLPARNETPLGTGAKKDGCFRRLPRRGQLKKRGLKVSPTNFQDLVNYQHLTVYVVFACAYALMTEYDESR